MNDQSGKDATPGKLTRKEIVAAIHTAQPDLGIDQSAKLVNSILRLLCELFSENNDVKISGFGKFVVQHKEARTARNLRTGVPLEIPKHRVVKFRPSKVLRDRLNAR